MATPLRKTTFRAAIDSQRNEIEMIEESGEGLRIVVLDTSIIIDGKATAMVDSGEIEKGARIIVLSRLSMSFRRRPPSKDKKASWD